MTMKLTKFKKYIISLAALLIAVIAMTACSSGDTIIEEPINEPIVKPDTPKTYTMTINATKEGAATTRALELSDKTLNATWATTENVYVQKGSTWATGSLKPQTNGTTATLKGTLSDITIAAGDDLTLQFPRSGAPDYTGQVGTLADIAAKYDYATATVKVASISSAGNINPEAATTTFTNQQAIVKFTLMKKFDNSNLKIPASTALTVNDGTNNYKVTPASATNVLFVAIPATSTVNLSTTIDGITYSYSKTGASLVAGKYYEIGVKMLRDVNLAKVNAATTLQNGDRAYGTLTNNVKISIADKATVTLDGVNINADDGSKTDGNYAGITCEGDATIILKDGTTNSVKGFHENYPGIYVPSGKTLTIQGETAGTGQLTASSNGKGAGIGGGYIIHCGNIEIKGGDVTSTGYGGAAGIGSGYGGECGNITIRGGVVTANGGTDPYDSGDGAGIGSGGYASCGNILISGGSVTATGGSCGAGIGSGSFAYSCGNITIEYTVTNVTAKKGGSGGLHSIGKGYESAAIGTIKIGDVVYPDGITDSPYTYKP